MESAITVVKTPWPIRALSFCFLAAPFGNVLISIANSAVAEWYHPRTFFLMVQSIPFYEWAWLTAVFICGVLLTIRHKLAWTVAISTLFLVLGINLFKTFANASELENGTFPMKYQLATSALVTMAVIVVIFYARFPYLDRRDSWFGKAAKRFHVNLRARVLAGQEGHAWIRSLSESGARLDWIEAIPLVELQQMELFILDFPITRLQARVVACEDRVLRVKFLGLSKEDKKTLHEWLQKDLEQAAQRAS